MIDIRTRLGQLKRPQLLVRAARHGVDSYRRARHLRNLLDIDDLPGHGDAIMQLFDLENTLNENRIAKNGNYSAARHVEVLIAISGEAREFLAVKA